MKNMEEKKQSINGQIRKTEIKRDAQIIQKELAAELKNITQPDDTAEDMNQAVSDVVKQEEEKLRQLKMGDAILQYIRTAEAQQKKMGEVLAQAAKANAELLHLNAERASSVLSAEQMGALLQREIPKIKVVNNYPDLLDKVDKNFTNMEIELHKMNSDINKLVAEQLAVQSARHNWVVGLLLIVIILQFIF